MSNNKYKILIADTDIKARKELSELLESNGYKVITAATAAEAVLMFKSYTPDIIISEFFLPDANGIFLIEKIKKESGVPIIILSDNGEEYNKVAAKRPKIVGYRHRGIFKPRGNGGLRRAAGICRRQ